MPGTPNDEIRGDSMPQANDDECGKLGEKNNDGYRKFPRFPQLAGERVEKIPSKPLREGHMPVVPKKGQVLLTVGLIEVFWQVESQENTHPNRNIGIASKVEKDLESIGEKHDP